MKIVLMVHAKGFFICDVFFFRVKNICIPKESFRKLVNQEAHEGGLILVL